MTTIQEYAAARNMRDQLAIEIANLNAAGITPSSTHLDLYREYKTTVARLREELRGWAA
jgi:hypothetical protein